MTMRSLWWIFILIAPLFVGCSKKDEPPAPVEKPSSVVSESGPKDQEGAPSAGQGRGTVSGKIIYKGSASVPKLSVGKDQEVCGTSKLDPTLVIGSQGEVKNAVVQIVGPSGTKAQAAKEAVLDQVKCEYVPHVLVIPVGTTLKIKNSDGILHNVHTVSKENTPFNRAQPKYLKEITATFEKPENVAVRCDVHAWMSGWIVVTDQAHYDVSASDGTFTLTDVPAGEHRLEIWHERLGKQEQRVKVGVGETVNVTFEFKAKT